MTELFKPLERDLFCCGVAYGGGLRARAASQSKGTEDEMEEVDAGEC